MVERMTSLPFYEQAEGSEDLKKKLNGLLENADSGKAINGPHYILYRLGAQESFIRVDMDPIPVRFWYCDLLGRPATALVKSIIDVLLEEKALEGVFTDNFKYRIKNPLLTATLEGYGFTHDPTLEAAFNNIEDMVKHQTSLKPTDSDFLGLAMPVEPVDPALHTQGFFSSSRPSIQEKPELTPPKGNKPTA
ncbi:MAG TPA: hypothetical protein VJN02_08330 [Gammaproteobacteria bacterium]|nr:hypothetical protein [Gammaproteobacteria bacterium]